MDEFSTLPVSVGVCTNVATLHPLPEKAITNAELAECFLNARRSNTHTQPLPSSERDIKKLLARLDTFNVSQLAPFLNGYMYSGKTIPDSVLDPIRTLCVNSDSEWAYKCQMLSFDLLCSELQVKGNSLVPRPRLDDPIALAQLRQTIPGMRRVPKVAIKQCNFKFVGVFSADPAVNEEVFAATVKVSNKGDYPLTLEVAQTQTIIDGVKVENLFLQSSIDMQVLKRGESIDVKLTVKEAPRAGFTEFQQVLVLAIDGVLKLFVTYSVVSPRQSLFGQRFPACLPLRVENSTLGNYNAPLMLQILKHVFIQQQGLSCAAVAHLMADLATNYRAHNRETMREVARAKDILCEQMNLTDVLNSYWASLPDAKKAPAARRHRPPVSSAQPTDYLPGIDLPTSSTSSVSAFFPNAYTRMPNYLTKAPAEVTMGLILLWLGEMDVHVFDMPFGSGDTVSYLEAMPPYLRGIVMWILDLCCALLQNRLVNGATERGLAVTFASVLMRPEAKQFGEEETDSEEMDENASEVFSADAFTQQTTGMNTGKTKRSLAKDVRIRQSAVTAFLNWLRLYNVRFELAL